MVRCAPLWRLPAGRAAASGAAGYCCLGVLCELAVKADAARPPVYDDEHEWWSYEGRNDLPQSVLEWSGLTDTNPEVLFRGERAWLAELNDGDQTFAEIADLIDGGAS